MQNMHDKPGNVPDPDMFAFDTDNDAVCLPSGAQALMDSSKQVSEKNKKLVWIKSDEHMITVNSKSYWKLLPQCCFFLDTQTGS